MHKEQNDYSAFDFDSLHEGREIKINHSLYVDKRICDISGYAQKSTDEVAKMRQASVDKETEIFKKICASVSEWEEQAAQTQTLDLALEYLRTPKILHTSNQWTRDMHGNFKISNMVYAMSHSTWEDCNYNRETGKREPVAWYVTWDVYARCPGNCNNSHRIAGQNHKRYTDKAAAEKYIQGRINAYSHLFTEISPPIPPEYAEYFKVSGLLLPGYTIKGQAPQRKEPAADVEHGGFSTPKPSMLGQLADAKAKSKKQMAPETPRKETAPEI